MINVGLEISKIYLEAAEKFRKLADEVKQDPNKKDCVISVAEHSASMLDKADKYADFAKMEAIMDFLK